MMEANNRLINAVLNMRHYQREYFKTRSKFCLREALKFEKKVDALLQPYVPVFGELKPKQFLLFNNDNDEPIE